MEIELVGEGSPVCTTQQPPQMASWACTGLVDPPEEQFALSAFLAYEKNTPVTLN